MATDDDEQSPFTRPGFITAAIVIALIVVLAIVLAIVNATRGDAPEPPASASPTPSVSAPTAEPSAAAGDSSVCGLKGEELTGTLTTAPDAEWEYQGTVAYPTSGEYGPGARGASGFGYCFQRSPAGALFAAAQAIAQGASPDNSEWLQYFAADGPFRDELLSQEAEASSATGTRLRIAGFRVLAYDGSSARIDLGGDASTASGALNFSAVYELVWSEGDWKVSTETATAFDFATIPNLAGYVSWGP